MKLLLTTDIHSGITRESSSRPGIIRQASSDAIRKIKDYQYLWAQLDFDAGYDLGDLIKPIHGDPNNKQLYQQAVETLKSIDQRYKFIPGNHDIDSVDPKEMLAITKQDSFLEIDYLDDWQILRLDQEQIDVNNAKLSTTSMQWVKESLKKEMKTIVLSHYSLAKMNMSGSFGFEGKDETTCYQNRNDILSILSEYNVRVAVSGHIHWAGNVKGEIFPIVGLLPFTDNVLASCDVNTNPGIYSILETNKEKISIKTYSGEFCFVSNEL